MSMFIIRSPRLFRSIESTFEGSLPDWIELTYLEIPRYGSFGFVYDNTLYVIGGVSDTGISSTVEKIDLSTLQRSYGASMPEGRAFFAKAIVGDKLYVIGGIDKNYMPQDTIFVYNIVYDSWATLSVKLPKGVAYCGSALLTKTDGTQTILITGGVDHEGNILNTVYEFDPVSESVTERGALNVARQNHTCATLNGIVYCFGGDNGTELLSSIEAYDPTTNTWTILDVTLPSPISGLTSIKIKYNAKDYILLIGG
jgi:Uncharacterized protein conserved in bacteria